MALLPFAPAAVLGDPSSGVPAPIPQVTCIPNVTVQGIPISVYGLPQSCPSIFHPHGSDAVPVGPLVGSFTVQVAGFGVHRQGDLRCCGLHVTSNSINKTVWVGV
jgi:uncharacterized Zn-binding protein involved in type VI secretion